MFAGNPSRPGGRRLRPYDPPAFTQMTPQAALLALKANTRPGDNQAERMLEAIEGEKILVFARDRPARTRFSKRRVSTVRRTTFLAVFSSL